MKISELKVGVRVKAINKTAKTELINFKQFEVQVVSTIGIVWAIDEYEGRQEVILKFAGRDGTEHKYVFFPEDLVLIGANQDFFETWKNG